MRPVHFGLIATFVLMGLNSSSPGTMRAQGGPIGRSARTPGQAQSAIRDHVSWMRRHHPVTGTAGVQPLPTFERSFEYGGLKYTDRFVGTDPADGPATTTIDTLIVPLRLEFSDGTVDAALDPVEGRTPLEWTRHSPLFVPTPFTAGATPLGTTLWSDAMVRANFWNEGANQSGYHLLLRPTVAPTSTLQVPPDKGSVAARAIDVDWLTAQVELLLSRLKPDPASLAVVIVGHDVWLDGVFGGLHNAVQLASRDDGALQTYVLASGIQAGGPYDPGVTLGVVLTHELSEWMSDPFIDNPTPPWTVFESRCQNNLETGDFMDFRPTALFQVTTTEGSSYLVEDQVFFDWFTRRPVSRSVNGWYSFQNSAPTPSASCYDEQRFSIRSVDVAGQFETFLASTNGRGDVVGNYVDASGVWHGMMMIDGESKVKTIDVPGASATSPGGINDDRQIVGIYIDAGGNQHGFTWQDGTFKTVDPVAGAVTHLDSISNDGVIVGGLVQPNGLPVERGVLIRGDAVQVIVPPFATDAEVTAISGAGQLAGYYGTYGNGFLDTAFVGVPGGFTTVPYGGPSPAAFVTIPTGISDRGVLAGFVYDLDGNYTGFFRQNGDWQRIGFGGFTIISGLNQHDIAAGYYYDDAAHRIRGMIVKKR